MESLEERRLLSYQVLSSFQGLNFAETQGFDPPDTHIAVGDKYIVEGVNTSIAVYDKSGNLLSSETMGQFFSPLGTNSSSFMSDPFIVWDDYVNRFYVTMLVVNETSTTVTSDILIAVSNDDNPADGFTEMQRIHINNTDLFDYPKVGFNADAVVIMTNVYDGTSGNFVDVQLVTIQKSTILDENPATFTDYLTTADGTNFNLWPAEMHGAAPGAPMLFVTEDGANQGAEMRVVSMTNELSNSPTVVDTNIPVTPYDPTPEPLDPGGPITAKIDGRTLSADWRNNMLLTTQDVGTTASSGAIGKTRFYEFNTSGTPALVQEGEIDQGQNDFTYEGAIAQDQNGNLAMTFLQSSSTQFMSMYVTAQSAGAPAGTMDAPTEVAAGQADEFGDTDAGGRVGDYAAAVLDPVDGSFWLANEYATADGFWGTLITHISVAPPATIKGHVFADVNDDATDDPGDPGLKGVKLYLDLNHDNIFDPATDPTAVTNSNGNFTFANLPPGTYTINTILAVGQVQTTVSPNITVAAGQTVSGTEIGVFGDGSISGEAYIDANGDGVLDGSETGEAGVQILLKDSTTNTIVRSQLTAADGTYSFQDLPPGTYSVIEIPRTGFIQTSTSPAPIPIITSNYQATDTQFPDLDFGNFAASSLSGVVFLDTNGNGILDGNESGLSGWQVQLIDPVSNAIIQTATTDTTGTYTFTNLGPGTYRLREVLQNGFLQSSANPPDQVSVSGATVTGLNFGNDQLGSLSGQVFNDLTATGVLASGDPGIAGWTVDLVNIATNASFSTTTDQNGNFSFTGLVPGTYSVQEELPSGWLETTPASANLLVTSGASLTGTTFGNFALASISGVVFNDVNGNGTQDAGDLGTSNFLVDLVDASNNSVLATETPAADGSFTFDNLAPGTYELQEEPVASWLQTTPAPASVTPVSGQNVTGVTFGNFQTFTISGQVFQDNNANGIEDGSDAGLQGWTVELVNAANNTVLLSTTSDVNGDFSFTGLTPGSYNIVDVAQSGWLQTTVNPTTIVGASGTNVTNISFGQFHSGSINGQVFIDINGDGKLDGNDAGIGSISVSLVNPATQAVVNTTTTNAQGNYTFNGAILGNYSVQVAVPSGSISTTPASESITVAGSGNNITGIDFALFQLGTISGSVLQDLSGSGQLNSKDTALSGFTVQLSKELSSTLIQVVASQTTSANGGFSFGNLQAGTYLASVSTPSGWLQTTTAPASITVTSGSSSTVAAFGEFKLGSISGQVYSDSNDSGVHTAGDPGVAGVQVQLVQSSSGAVLATTTTDGNGNFTFGNLKAGTYGVHVIAPASAVSTTPVPAAVTITSGSAFSGLSFGEFIPGKVSGRVFNDSYGDGIESAEMSGLAGYTITLYQVATSGLVKLSSTVSAGDGTYSFSGLAAGAYELQETPQAGHIATFPNPSLAYTFSIVSGSSVLGEDFGDIGSANRSFVFQAYHDLLGRSPDHAGMDHWSNLLDHGTARNAVVSGLQSSTEYRTSEINALYEKLLGRAVDPAGLQTALSLFANTQYVFGQGDLLLQFEVGILASPEYFAVRGGGTNAGFLSALYSDILGRSIDASGAAQFGAKLAAGVSRALVVKSILYSVESESRIVNSDYVAYLHRNADPIGLNSFLAYLQEGGSNDAIINALMSSNEYFQDT